MRGFGRGGGGADLLRGFHSLIDKVSILTDGGRHTDQFQASTCRAWPCICRGRITLDLPFPTTITRPHYWNGQSGHLIFICIQYGLAYLSASCVDCVHRRIHNLSEPKISPRLIFPHGLAFSREETYFSGHLGEGPREAQMNSLACSVSTQEDETRANGAEVHGVACYQFEQPIHKDLPYNGNNECRDEKSRF
jgi:hypothetical protein